MRVNSIAAALLVLCATAAIGTDEPDQVDLSVLTYNVLHGADDNGVLNLEAKGDYISSIGADLALLQEIDQNCERTGRVDQIAVLGQLTGMEAAFGAFMPYQGGLYGIGTLSGLPVRSTRALRLPEGDEPRVALLSELEVLGRQMLVVNVHFNWTKDDTSRYAQAVALLEELSTIDLPTIVAGDFNDEPGSRTMRAFYDADFRHVDQPGASWDAQTPTVDIDHILVRSGRGLRLEPVGGEVLDERTLSDHRPVLGRIRVATTPLR